MSRRRRQPQSLPNTAKRRLLEKVIALQRAKRADAETHNDADEMERIEKRMLTVEALIEDLETR